jgi:hypothetical protein
MEYWPGVVSVASSDCGILLMESTLHNRPSRCEMLASRLALGRANHAGDRVDGLV